MTKLSYRLTDDVTPARNEVGSKGLSLMRLTRAGYPVPRGFILTTAFFDPWLKGLHTDPAWSEFLTTDSHNVSDAGRRVQRTVQAYTLNESQVRLLAAELSPWHSDTLFAVRSSAPGEDLSTASYAGVYKTVLGVRSEDVAKTLPLIVASIFDRRLIAYRRQPAREISFAIAVLVQEQVPSEVAGVAFSVNPVSGNATQAVVEANWGLGQTVVDGTISPDYFLVDKATGRILHRRLGQKKHSLVVIPGGATIGERRNDRPDLWTLDENTIQELTQLLIRLEGEHGYAIDMEWAFTGDHVLILQVRPVTGLTVCRPESEGK
jgi:phosphoenolpyruvate synthase/pyruvate phosphate dikinase